MDTNIQEAKWYVLHVRSTYEFKVQRSIELLVENNNLKDFIVDVAVPTIDEVVEKDGKKKVKTSKKFAGYVFVKMIYSKEIGYQITRLTGVTGIIGPRGGNPSPLLPEDVRRMRLEKVDESTFDFNVGDNIVVINGFFENNVGVIQSVNNEKKKVKVVMQIFGRETAVDLDFETIEKVKN